MLKLYHSNEYFSIRLKAFVEKPSISSNIYTLRFNFINFYPSLFTPSLYLLYPSLLPLLPLFYPFFYLMHFAHANANAPGPI